MTKYLKIIFDKIFENHIWQNIWKSYLKIYARFQIFGYCGALLLHIGGWRFLKLNECLVNYETCLHLILGILTELKCSFHDSTPELLGVVGFYSSSGDIRPTPTRKLFQRNVKHVQNEEIDWIRNYAEWKVNIPPQFIPSKSPKWIYQSRPLLYSPEWWLSLSKKTLLIYSRRVEGGIWKRTNVKSK